MDIVERLRQGVDEYEGIPKTEAAMDRAADEIERLRAALRDAHKLIDNELVVPWIMAHKLDDVLGLEQLTPTEK